MAAILKNIKIKCYIAAAIRPILIKFGMSYSSKTAKIKIIAQL